MFSTKGLIQNKYHTCGMDITQHLYIKVIQSLMTTVRSMQNAPVVPYFSLASVMFSQMECC